MRCGEGVEPQAEEKAEAEEERRLMSPATPSFPCGSIPGDMLCNKSSYWRTASKFPSASLFRNQVSQGQSSCNLQARLNGMVAGLRSRGRPSILHDGSRPYQPSSDNKAGPQRIVNPSTAAVEDQRSPVPMVRAEVYPTSLVGTLLLHRVPAQLLWLKRLMSFQQKGQAQCNPPSSSSESTERA